MAHFIRNALGRVFVAFSSIRIESSLPTRLVLNVNGSSLTIDKPSQTIASSRQPIARFSAIEFIEIQQWQNGKGYQWWVVNLRVAGDGCLRVGRTVNDAQASIAAAHLGTITGKEVRVQRKWSAV
ncbi:MAG: hypothetical protein ACK4OE_22060 [Acidovorax sp.]|uniref:hypothetical protein n=1 Tax=Acidovorax sp. TaxID=1872122 RepID=UPI00391BF8F8